MLMAASDRRRAVAGGSHERHRQRMSARLRGDLSAAFAQVIAAIIDGCLDGAARREGISEIMRVHQRVLRTLRPVLITSPEGQTACPEPWATQAASSAGTAAVIEIRGGKQRGVPALPNVKTAR